MGSEWKIAKIESVAEKVAMGPFGSSIKVETFVPSGVPVISGQHLHGSKVDDSVGFNFITEEHAKRLKNAIVQRGDIIFTHAGNIGQVAVIPITSKYERYVISQRQFYMRCNRSKVLPEFVVAYFKTPEGQHKLLANTSQTGVPSIAQPVTYLRTIEIPLPPLNEQHAIAHILGTLDDKIELNRRMSVTLEEMARAIFKSWFVDFDPVRAKAAVRREHPDWTNAQVNRAALPTLKPEIAELFPDEFVDSELGMIPKGWRVKSFTDDVDVIGGGTPKTSTPEYWGGKIPWFSVVDTPAEGEIFVISTEKTLTQEGINNSSTRVLPVGTTIITARGTVGNIALVGIPMAMNQSCYGLHDLRGNKGYFLYFVTKSTVETLRQRTHGSVFNTITRDTLKSVRVVSPPSELISKFEGTVGTMLERNLSNLHESHILATCRDILLPKLISGTLRVEDAESFIKETI